MRKLYPQDQDGAEPWYGNYCSAQYNNTVSTIQIAMAPQETKMEDGWPLYTSGIVLRSRRVSHTRRQM